MEFILVGLTNSPKLQTQLFWLFLLIYAMALFGNLLLVLAICTYKKLHTPMYFLLINLSVVNVFSISVTTPKLLQILLTRRKAISFYGCIAQVFFFIWALSTELLILAFMAFDRYAAICHPLQYTMIMRKEVCVKTAAGLWTAGMVHSAIEIIIVLQLSFCNSNIINHYYCDLLPVVKLSCTDSSMSVRTTFAGDTIFGIGSCAFTVMSYSFILRAICRICSTEGKKKAFSTCSSHIIVLTFYFSTVIYTYFRSSSASSLERDKVISLFFSVITPVLNPVIYSLRNKDVIEALKKLMGRAKVLQKS
ncbi:olfactory receptor 5F1-like [Tiliqua scincoides]|uniref:olfactory receptor 5F1-like n=1 Tax=Tiliqua scincoides TaxID=71010 RepID=UPI003461DE45